MENKKNSEVENAIEATRQFTVTAPTFSFDGMEESLQLKLITINKSIPPQYQIKAIFSCRNSGYGDRTDKVLITVITPHVMEVTVIEGKVTSAIIDKKWDEVNQQQSKD